VSTQCPSIKEEEEVELEEEVEDIISHIQINIGNLTLCSD
jgi:hypothetical protein